MIRKGGHIFMAMFSVLCLLSFGQKNQIDSVLATLTSPNDDSLRCVYLRAYVEFETDNNIWPVYNEKLRKIAEDKLKTALRSQKMFYLQMLSDTYINDGYLKQQNGKFSEALKDYHKSLQIKFDINDRGGIATNLVNMGYVYYAAADYKKAAGYFNKALTIQEELKDKQEAALTLANLANVFWRQKDTARYLELVNKSLLYRQQSGDQLGVAKCYNLLVMAQAKSDPEKAFDYSNRALKIFAGLDYKDGLINTLNNIGGLYYRTGKAKEAADHYERALAMAKSIKDYRGASVSLYNLGDIRAESGGVKNALRFYEEAFRFARLSGELVETRNACQGLAAVFKKTGDMANADKYSKLYEMYRDSIEKKVAITIIEAPFDSLDVRQNSATVQLQAASEDDSSFSSIWIWLASGLIVAALIALFIFIRRS